MWERIEIELEEVDIESLGFDHPLCSGVLDVKSEPFTKIPGSFCDIFKEPFEKYKLDYNNMIMDTYREIIYNEELKINLDKDLNN
ncbi:18624_t:CDS:1, partial [Funneliformis geosporum]